MPFFVYILQSKKDNKHYIGMTSNLEQRLFQHNSGLVKSTKNRIPLELIYSEEFENKSDALNREKELKTKKGKLSFLK
jgi:putative endonuclease